MTAVERRRVLRLILAAGAVPLSTMSAGYAQPSASGGGARPTASECNMITLFLCGDVMIGRGIDQILPHPSPPHLHEPYVTSALYYVALAEQVNGPIPRHVDFGYVWGDALAEFDRHHPDV